MCGIAGILRPEAREKTERDADERAVSAMLSVMERRGPDGQGLQQCGRLTVGHRRLAIIDRHVRANQPLISDDGRYALTFNGEIYNHRDLIGEMGLVPDDLRTRSDTEVLLRAWMRWGPQCLDRLVGPFAFALYDVGENVLWLVRDRFGEKPLFYHESGEAWSFASSIGALLEVPWIERALDPDCTREYLSLRYCLAPRTIVRGVQKLRPGALLRIGPQSVASMLWYTESFGQQRRIAPPEDLVAEFDFLLRQASRRCLVGDVPKAIFLSDGIDSAGISESVDRSVPAFTFVPHGPGEPMLDASPGSALLRASSEERFAAMVPAFSSMSEPNADGAALATWLLLRRAREHAVIFLCGHGADELLGGYRLSQVFFRLTALRSLSWLPEPIIGSLIRRYTDGPESIAGRRRRLRSLPRHRWPEATRYLINRPLPLADLTALFPSLGDPIRGGGVPDQDSTSDYMGGVDGLYHRQPKNASGLDRVQNVMLSTFLSQNILSWTDSVSMDVSSELRMPFLDRDLASFAFRLPMSARIGRWPGRSNTKLILRWWGRVHLDASVVRRRKRTFAFGSMGQMLSKYGEEMRSWVLDSPALARAVPGAAAWVANEPSFFAGPRRGTLWALLSLGIWCQHHRLR